MKRIFKPLQEEVTMIDGSGKEKVYTLKELSLRDEEKFFEAIFNLDINIDDPSLLGVIKKSKRAVAELISRFILPEYDTDYILDNFTHSQMQHLFEMQEKMNHFSARFEMLINSLTAYVDEQKPAPVQEPAPDESDPSQEPPMFTQGAISLPWWKKLLGFTR